MIICDMDTLQLSHALSTDPFTRATFLNVFPSDWLPVSALTQRPVSLVVNTHPHFLPGEHWVAIYLSENNHAEFFDSYGLPPFSSRFPKTIMNFLKKNSDKILFHKLQLQDPASTTCGYHCLFFLHQRCRGLPFHQVLRLYSADPEQNDRMVTSFVKRQRCTRTPLIMYPCNQSCVSCTSNKVLKR